MAAHCPRGSVQRVLERQLPRGLHLPATCAPGVQLPSRGAFTPLPSPTQTYEAHPMPLARLGAGGAEPTTRARPCISRLFASAPSHTEAAPNSLPRPQPMPLVFPERVDQCPASPRTLLAKASATSTAVRAACPPEALVALTVLRNLPGLCAACAASLATASLLSSIFPAALGLGAPAAPEGAALPLGVSLLAFTLPLSALPPFFLPPPMVASGARLHGRCDQPPASRSAQRCEARAAMRGPAHTTRRLKFALSCPRHATRKVAHPRNDQRVARSCAALYTRSDMINTSSIAFKARAATDRPLQTGRHVSPPPSICGLSAPR